MKKKQELPLPENYPLPLKPSLEELFDPKFNLDDTPFSESQLNLSL